MPRSFLIKKKSDRESLSDRSEQGGAGCDDVMDQPCNMPSRDLSVNGKQEPKVVDNATLLIPARRTTIWSPAAEIHNKTSTANASPTSGLTPITPLSAAAAAAAAFLHPKGSNILFKGFCILSSAYKYNIIT